MFDVSFGAEMTISTVIYNNNSQHTFMTANIK